MVWGFMALANVFYFRTAWADPGYIPQNTLPSGLDKSVCDAKSPQRLHALILTLMLSGARTLAHLQIM